MTTSGKNKQSMGNSMTETFDRYNGTWQASQIFSDSVQRHKDNMKNIAFWQAKQLDALSLHGLVRDKNLLRSLITITDERVKAGILALAISINDNTLASKVQFPTSLQSMSDSRFLASSKKVKEVADENALKLIPMGITNQVLNDMELDLTAFEKIIKKPKALRGQVTVYTKNLNNAVKTMFTFLRTSVTCQVKSLYPRTDFADAFKANSKVYNYKSHETILRGTVADTNGKHLRNVRIELVNYPVPGESTFRNTNGRGNYAFKHFDLTSAILRIHAKKYTTAEYSVTVTKGKVTIFDILLIPESAPVTSNA
jgi:hypothetical protein